MKPFYQDDLATLYHGDALEIIPELNQDIGAVVTDPPYSSGGQFRGDRMASTSAKYQNSGSATVYPEFTGDNRDQRAYLIWSMFWISAAKTRCLAGAPFCVFTDWRQLPTTTDAVQCAGLVWRNIAMWWKPGVRMQKGRFSSSAEFVVYATNGPATGGMGNPQNVTSCGIEPNKTHIAEKPLAVMDWILGVVPEGATILDPFAGSGTTLVSAKKNGCRSIGIEFDKKSCEAAATRLKQNVLFGA